MIGSQTTTAKGASAAHSAMAVVARASGMLVAILLASVHVPALAQSVAASAQQAPPPAELSAAFTAQLAGPGARVTIGETTLEFWWAKTIPGAKAGSGWSDVENGTFVGALRVTGAFKDVRGKPVKPGVYTLRFGIQPQNGDHLGVSPNREFLLLGPAASDRDARVLGFDGAVAIAKQTTGTSHPASLSIDPPESDGAMLSSFTTEMGHSAVVFEGGGLKFGLILVGTIVH